MDQPHGRAERRPFGPVGCACCASRRSVLAGLGAAALAAPAVAAAPRSAPRRIVDLHCHFATPAYAQAGPGFVAGPLTTWTPALQLETMDRNGIARAVLSVATPGVPLPGEAGRKLARELNEYGARLGADHPGRFGLFAVLPMAEMDGALAETAYALDTLKAGGIGLLTNHNGKWLGDPAFDPLFQELDRRRAVVFVHPTSAPCCGSTLTTVGPAVIEWGTDTTRAITNYVYSGAARRFPNVRLIFSHAGGTMPFLIERFQVVDRDTPAARTAAPDGFRAAVGKFFFDTAQASNSVAMGALRQVVPTSQIVFGTDFPFRTPGEQTAQIEAAAVFNAAELAGIYRGHVAASLPGLLA